MTYSEKLKDPRWQKKRLEILNRDNWQCVSCLSKDKTLHIHHVDYLKGKDPWEYDDEYLMTLCYECHKEFTEELPRLEKELISTLRPALKDTLNWRFTIDVFEKYDTENLLWLLFHCRERKDEVIDYLRNMFYEISEQYLQKANDLNNG